ncbi:MAG: MFS transporter [Firmicutes bacterium]|nr:MFS transporter [Bacillota bacterium]
MEKKRRIHPAWIILFGMTLVQGGFIGVGINCISVLFAGITENMGFASSKLSLYYTIRGLISASLVAPAVSLFMKKKNAKMIAVMGFLVGISLCLMSLYNHVWQWYISAAINALGACMGPMMVPMVINAWFHKKRGLATGIAMSASGIFGALLSPACGGIIESLGWRAAAVFMGVCLMALTMIPSLLFIRITPEQMGCRAYGADEEKPENEQPREIPGEKKYSVSSFAMMGFAMLVFTVITQFAFLIPTYSRVLGYATMVGATLTSIAMIGNIGFKLIFGAAVDRFGVHRTTIATLILGAGAFCLLMMGSRSALFLYAGSFLFGSLYSLGTIASSLLCISVFGRDYQKPMSRISAVTQVAAAFATPFYSFVYEASASFVPVLVGCAVACLLPTGVLVVLAAQSRRQNG